MTPGPRRVLRLAIPPALVVACSLATAVAATPQVSVSAGQPLQQKSATYGTRDIDQLTRDLARIVGERLDRTHAPSAPVKLQLVLQDATPNRPTSAELGDNAGLSLSSVGLGGAWINGTAVLADGRKVPIGFSFYETDLDQEVGAATWTDAHRAFDALADRLAKGDIPDQAAPTAPAPVSFAHWPR